MAVHQSVWRHVMRFNMVRETEALLDRTTRSLTKMHTSMPRGLQLHRHDPIKGSLLEMVIVMANIVVSSRGVVMGLFARGPIRSAIVQAKYPRQEFNVARVCFICDAPRRHTDDSV